MHATHHTSCRSWGILFLFGASLCTAFGPDERRTVGDLSYTWSPERCDPAALPLSRPFTYDCLGRHANDSRIAENACAKACYDFDQYCIRAECIPPNTPNRTHTDTDTDTNPPCPVGEFTCYYFRPSSIVANSTILHGTCLSDIVEAP